MSKFMTAGLIAVAFAILASGVTLGLRSGYSQFAAASFGVLPALLVIFPIVRERSEGQITFVQWVGMLFISLLLAIVINNLGVAMTEVPMN